MVCSFRQAKHCVLLSFQYNLHFMNNRRVEPVKSCNRFTLLHVPSVLGMSTGIYTYLISEDFQIHNGSEVVNQEQSWFQKTSIAQKLDIKRQSQARLAYIIQCIYPSRKQEPSLADLFPPDIVFLIVDLNLGRKKHI